MKLPWQKDKPLFTEEEQQRLVQAIQNAEQRTSGEVRLFIEPHCRYVHALDRAQEIFFEYKMNETALHNGILIYVAVKDHQAAVYGDEGIHRAVGAEYWKKVVAKMFAHFAHDHLTTGICAAIEELGEALYHYFPYDQKTDKNELPDEIIFGR